MGKNPKLAILVKVQTDTGMQPRTKRQENRQQSPFLLPFVLQRIQGPVRCALSG